MYVPVISACLGSLHFNSRVTLYIFLIHETDLHSIQLEFDSGLKNEEMNDNKYYLLRDLFVI